MRRFGRILVAFLAVIGALTTGFVAFGLWAAANLGDGPAARLPSKMVLTLDLEGAFHEAPATDPLARLSGSSAYVLAELVEALDRAGSDERVGGLFATIGSTPLGMAGAQELRDAVIRFRAAGKPAVIFAETIGEMGDGTIETYLASAFGQIWLQPSGDVGLTGFAIETPFLKGLFAKLGIEPQVLARHEYKSAVETFTEAGYTRPHRETLNALLAAWTDQAASGIAAGRKLPLPAVQALIGKGPFLGPEAQAAGLVDRLGYREEAQAALGVPGPAEEVDIADYAAHLKPKGGAKVALVTGVGPIHRGPSGGLGGGQGFGSDSVAEALRDAALDPDIRAILFRVDSPGGSYVASDVIWHEVRRAREAGKPVVVSMGEVAASGGYFVAMGADRVIAQPGTITGSIGVFAGKPVLKDFWDKLGISWDSAARGDNARMWSVNQGFTPEAKARLDRMLDRIYEDFTTKAAQGRNIPIERMDQLARGRVWSGADAKSHGLVDDLGGYPQALAAVRTLAGLPADAPLDLVPFPKPPSPFEMLMTVLGDPAAVDPGIGAWLRVGRLIEPWLRPGRAEVLSLPMAIDRGER